MKENINIRLEGQVTIRNRGKIIFRESNTITGNNLQILMMCLANVPLSPSIDVIVANGDFGSVDLSVFDSVYDTTEKSITFMATAFEESFQGTVTDLELKCSLLGLNLAVKTGVSYAKDDETRLQFDWKIKITNC